MNRGGDSVGGRSYGSKNRNRAQESLHLTKKGSFESEASLCISVPRILDP